MASKGEGMGGSEGAREDIMKTVKSNRERQRHKHRDRVRDRHSEGREEIL